MQTLRDSLNLQFESVWPYFALMGIFLLTASMILRWLPFFRKTLASEINKQNHASQLDGLRGLLALAVFFTHAQSFQGLWRSGVWNLPNSNFYSQLGVAAVALFFMITGYLFWTRAQKRAEPSWAVFFQHRVQRILPTYLLVLLLLLAFVSVATEFHWKGSTVSFVRAVSSFLTFGLISGSSLNGLESTPLIYATDVFWTLRIEWTFYLSFPLLAWFARSTWRQVWLAWASFCVYFFLPEFTIDLERLWGHRVYGLGSMIAFNFWLFSYFSFGMLAAYLKRHYQLESIASSSPASITALAISACVLFLKAPLAGPVEGMLLAVPFLITILGNTYFGLLRRQPLMLLGQISYSTYVLHCLVLYCGYLLLRRSVPLEMLTPYQFWLFTGVDGIVVVCISALSYRFVEFPFMRKHLR